MNDDDPFKQRELEVQRLRRENEEFEAAWSDYQEVREVLRRLHARSDPSEAMLDDYTRLQSELRCEIEEWLAPPLARRTGSNGGRT
ncbi:hypothetical protein [Sedimentitalea todarodis]|uniref:Uncharacterized protein n=1 Tax=Sedimentitalea todarodis TaxID=1631240 RepID=A0ABU3VH19_9RHOB|nr:hypothetical protein [Sedimentitalea todarodis]MDU9005469.1 hypothetical protein [Sedimentitalea todarodis]